MKFQIVKTLFTVVCTLFSFLPVKTLASPIPAMGSSLLSTPSKAYMFNVHGFSLVSTSTNWQLQNATASDADAVVESTTETPEKNPEISVRFQNPNSAAFLSVKTEALTQPTSIEFYTKKWIRDYSFYGFDILGAKEFSQGNARGYVIDLYHAKQNKQLRQVVFLKEKTAVILTCTDDKSQFTTILNSCNSIVKSFRWL